MFRDNGKIDRIELAERLPRRIEPDLLEQVCSDLDICIAWRSGNHETCHFDKERDRIYAGVRKRFYCSARPIYNAPTWQPVLVAAERLFKAGYAPRFYPCLNHVYRAAQTLVPINRIVKFDAMDLTDIEFQRIEFDDVWVEIAERRAAFADPQSIWQKLDKMQDDEVPDAALLGIVYQYNWSTDPRNYEHWHGTMPGEMATRFGPRLRDALLTYIEYRSGAGPPGQNYRIARMACDWPYEVAAPIVERAIQSGWFDSLVGLPESTEWRTLLDMYRVTAFGEIGQHIEWFGPEN